MFEEILSVNVWEVSDLELVSCLKFKEEKSLQNTTGKMSQRKKILYGLFGIIIGLCVGALFRNYRTLEIVSMCNSINSMKQKSEYCVPFELYTQARSAKSSFNKKTFSSNSNNSKHYDSKFQNS